MRNSRRYAGAIIGPVLAGALALLSFNALAVEKERINPPGVFKHPTYPGDYGQGRGKDDLHCWTSFRHRLQVRRTG